MKKIITILNTLTINSFTTSVATSCNKELKINPNDQKNLIDLNKITADEIINILSEYRGLNDEDEEVIVTPDKLGSLNNDYIEDLLEENLSMMFFLKLNGMNKTKLHNLNDFAMLSAMYHKKVIKHILLKILAISFDIKSKGNSKKFTLTIEINDKDKAFEQDPIMMEQKIDKYFYLSDVKIDILSSIHGLNKKEFEVRNNEIMAILKFFSRIQDFDPIKSMYDSIKGKKQLLKLILLINNNKTFKI